MYTGNEVDEHSQLRDRDNRFQNQSSHWKRVTNDSKLVDYSPANIIVRP